VKKPRSVRKLVLNRETLATLKLNEVSGGYSDVSVCWPGQTRPLCE
jgi:hypothetical protein